MAKKPKTTKLDGAPAAPGRPTLFNPKLEAALLKLLRQSVSRRTACLKCGIGLRTLLEWMERGKAEPESDWGRFRTKVREAEADAESAIVINIHQQALENAHIGMQWLTLRHPQRFNPKQRVEMSGDPKRPLLKPYDVAKLSDAELDVLEQLAEKATPVPPSVVGNSSGESEEESL